MRNYREASRYEDLVCAFLKTQIKTLVSVRQREKKDHGTEDLGCYPRWYVRKRVLGLSFFLLFFGGGGGVWGVCGAHSANLEQLAFLLEKAFEISYGKASELFDRKAF